MLDSFVYIVIVFFLRPKITISLSGYSRLLNIINLVVGIWGKEGLAKSIEFIIVGSTS